MRILLIGYWALRDPLTTATILPNIELLQQFDQVEHIVLATIERQHEAEPPATDLPFPNQKTSFWPLHSRPGGSLLLTKADDFIRFPRELAALMKAERLDTIIGHGATGAALAYLVSRRTGCPFYATMYEPHADYMLDSGIWPRHDPRYWVQRMLETRVKRRAAGIFPAADGYCAQLTREGVPAARLRTGPCMVRLNEFRFDAAAGQRVRQRLGFPEHAVVGVYMGKFGGLYYNQEAFEIFKAAAAQFGPHFRLLVLSPNPAAEVWTGLAAVGISGKYAHVMQAAHHEVPGFLSAADFAFATVKFAPSNRFRSLMKVAEYWACGLPVLLTEGVGDESDIVAREGGGAIFNLARPTSLSQALASIEAQLQQPDRRAHIRQLAERYRSPERNRQAFQQLLPVTSVVS